jgi:hypothetical protein
MAKKYVRSTNLAALKEQLENQKTGSGFKFWKPKKFGKYTVRFLPQQSDEGFFYKETAQHKVGDNYIFCPKTEGDDCPICNLYRKLWDKGTDEAIKLAREIKPRKQYLYNIIVKDELGQPSEDPTKVQVFMSGKKIFEKLMDYFFDPDYGDLTSVEEGFDFVINKEHGSQGFPNYDNSRPRNKPSVLHDDDDIIEEILDGIKNLDKEIEYKSYEELEKILSRFISSETDMVEASESTPAPKAKKKVEPVDEDDDDDEEDLDDFKKQLLAGLED